MKCGVIRIAEKSDSGGILKFFKIKVKMAGSRFY
jgi:hypothetical protein